MKKKILSILMTLTLGLMVFVPSISQAAGSSPIDKQKYESKEEVSLAKQLQNAKDDLSNLNVSNFKKKISKLDDDQYSRFMHNYVMNNPDSTTVMTEKLNRVDVEFHAQDKGVVKAMSVSPSDVTLSVYSSKRGGEAYWHLQTSWDSTWGENKPATLDVLSIEWDPSYGAYYSSVVPSDGITTKKDGSKRANGIYLFNVDDTKYSFDSYCSVLVTANK